MHGALTARLQTDQLVLRTLGAENCGQKLADTHSQDGHRFPLGSNLTRRIRAAANQTGLGAGGGQGPFAPPPPLVFGAFLQADDFFLGAEGTKHFENAPFCP